MSKWQEQKKLVLETSQRLVEKGLVAGKSGNVSLRLPLEAGQELLAITPSSRYYDSLTVDDIQVIDFEAEPVEGDLIPSVETMLHIGIYQARKDINAVIHTHSVFASAVSVAGLDIPPILDDQVVFIGGEIKLAEYALSSSQELADNAVVALGERNAILLPNHGAIGAGRTLCDALVVCELLERTAQVFLCTLALGKVNPLPPEALAAGRAFFAMLQHTGD